MNHISTEAEDVITRVEPSDSPMATASPHRWNPRQRESLEALRLKWQTVPAAADGRVSTADLASMTDAQVVRFWEEQVRQGTAGENFAVRGWYHDLYRDSLRGKRVLDVGAGMGIDGLTFAQHGAEMTLLDIVPANVAHTKRLSRLLGLRNVASFLMEDLDSLNALRRDYDVIWCQGSLINAPFDFVRAEVQALLEHLPVGGRWIELAYPKQRWEREGRLPFEKWGEKTDGEGTPWVEWYDLEKLQAALAPARFDVVLHFNFHGDDFNWFDLVRRAETQPQWH